MQMLPMIALQTQDAAPAQNPPEQPPAASQPAQEKTEPASPDTSKPVAIAPKKKKAKKKLAKTETQSQDSSIVVIRNGGTLDKQGQISYSETDQQTLEKRKNTDALLSATTTNLQQVSGKQLNSGQQDMVKQIHTYMAQSKSATRTGDIQGANNLAVKAHLLSQELVKPNQK